MSSWGATLRIARRDARRARGRSLLVVAMIALPVMGVTAIDVVARTFELSTDQLASREMGAADAVFSDSGQVTVRQTSGDSTEGGDAPRPAGETADVTAVLPPGSRAVVDRTVQGAVAVMERTTTVQLRELAYTDPIAEGLYVETAGRPPVSAEEVALTSALAERLGVGLGGRVQLVDQSRDVTVVGLVEDQNSRANRTVLLAPGTLGPVSRETGERPTLLVDTGGTLTWADVQAANSRGVLVRPRGPVLGEPPPETYSSGDEGRTYFAIVLVVGMALLEVVLLAGPAFAVGAKRSARQLALLSATGAERRDIRRTVLGGGLVLGSIGGLLGVAAGLALAAGGVPLLARLDSSVPGPFDVRVLELAAIALVGVGTAVLAALLPARAAGRQDVVAALTGRRGAVASSRRTPVLGLLAALAGAALALYGARQRDVVVILAGSAMAELGLVATTPFLVGLTGRLGPLLPVAPRLALRDAARNRARTAPAVAAILAAVAGSVAVGTFVSSLDAKDRAAYSPQALPGTAVLSLYDRSSRDRLGEVRTAVEQSLPTREVMTVQALDSSGATPTGYAELTVPPDKACPLHSQTDVTQEQLTASQDDPRCSGYPLGGGYLPSDVVGDAAVLRAISGVQDPSLDRVLAAGGMVVPLPLFLDSAGNATVVVHPPDDVDGTRGRTVVLPAASLPTGAMTTTLYSPQAAAQLGLPIADAGLVAVLDRLPTDRERDTVQGALERLGLDQQALYVERGYVSDYGPGLLALALGSALLVLGASGIATGLAAADGRADLATLAAVGATPSVRRVLAAFQSVVTAGLGTALGVVAGLVPAIGLLRALSSTSGLPAGEQAEPFPLVIPWENVAVTAIVVPLVAALAAAVLTRSRLPLVSRMT